MRTLPLLLSAILLSPAAFAQEGTPATPVPHRRLLAMAYVGTQLFTGEIWTTDEDVNPAPAPGVRLGGLIGFRALSTVSLNVELSMDLLNLDSRAYGVGTRGVRASLSLAPLYHLALGKSFELVVGPKLGYWYQNFSNADFGLVGEERGHLWGLNAGGFVRRGDTLLGALFSFENAVFTEECTTEEFCFPDRKSPPEKIYTFSIAAHL